MSVKSLYDYSEDELQITTTKNGTCDKCGDSVSPEPEQGGYRSHGYDVVNKNTGRQETFCYSCMPKSYGH